MQMLKLLIDSRRTFSLGHPLVNILHNIDRVAGTYIIYVKL